MRASGERGQALPIVLLLVALTGAALLVVGRVGARAAAAARARSAADAAALAGAAAGPEVAREVARLNGSSATVVSGTVGDVTVTVRVGGEEAQARAVGPGAGAGTGGLVPELQAAITRATALLGRPIPIVSGLRTHAEQAALWARRATNPYPVAAPGTSAHERGRAIDVPRSFVPVLVRVAAAAGLCRPLPTSDPVHFEPCRPS